MPSAGWNVPRGLPLSEMPRPGISWSAMAVHRSLPSLVVKICMFALASDVRQSQNIIASSQVLWSILYHSNFGRCGSRCGLERPGQAKNLPKIRFTQLTLRTPSSKAPMQQPNSTTQTTTYNHLQSKIVQADLMRARPAAAACRAVCADPAQSPLPRQRLPWKEPVPGTGRCTDS